MPSAVTTHPKLRTDLVLSRRERNGSSLYVIKDPTCDRYFQFREAEFYLSQQLDGVTSLESIRHGAEQHFGASLPPSALEGFVDRLSRLGLLERDRPDAEGARPNRRGRIRGNLLYLRFHAFDPDRFFERLVPYVRWFFTPGFVILTAGLIALTLFLTTVHQAGIRAELATLYRFDAFVLLWAVLMGVVTLHEFAHGLACKHFGGKVRELGFMLIFLQPAMYCNVSDAWLFPEKSRRLWVTFAGAYFELFLWGMATLTWRVTDPDVTLHYLAFVVMVTSGVKTIFNLNPLIKLDGYYLLSDLLEVPNLNRRAFAYLWGRINQLLGIADENAVERVPKRESRILLIYGLVAGAFSLFLLSWIATRFGGYLVGQYQGTGFLLAAGLWAVLFRQPLKSASTLPANWLASAKGRARTKRIAKGGLGLGIIAAMLFFGFMELQIGAPFTIVPDRNAEVRAEVEGTIAEVFVDEGDVVASGQPLVQLSDLGYRAELQKVDAEIAAIKAKLKMLQAGPTSEEVQLAQSELDTARAKMQTAREQYEEAKRVRVERLGRAQAGVAKAQEQFDITSAELQRVRALFQKDAGSQKEIRDAEALMLLRQKELEEAQADLRVIEVDDLAPLRDATVMAQKQMEEADKKLALLRAGSRPEAIEETQADVSRLKAQRDYLAEQIELLTLRSPIPGVVTTPKLKEKVGQLLEKGDLVACVNDVSRLSAEITVPEKEIADIHVGQKVLLKARAFPHERFEGHVAAIAPAAVAEDEWQSGKTILVTAQIDNAFGQLKPQMTGHAKIQCGRRRILEVATRRLVRYVKVEFWSWW